MPQGEKKKLERIVCPCHTAGMKKKNNNNVPAPFKLNLLRQISISRIWLI
jgi:hypothetical protein